ncbi:MULTISPECIES: hypothetical protein [Saccharothrix]|nr:hypothetical protein [Saccharothrix sp. CB00851]
MQQLPYRRWRVGAFTVSVTLGALVVLVIVLAVVSVLVGVVTESALPTT